MEDTTPDHVIISSINSSRKIGAPSQGYLIDCIIVANKKLLSARRCLIGKSI